MRTLAYVRVSTDEQGRSGVSLAAQEAAIAAEVARRGWELLEVVVDEGASGGSLDRPGLCSALERIAAGEADVLMATKLDRLSRSVGDFATLLEWFTEADAALVALDLALDTSTPGGRLVANVFASVAEWERSIIASRTKEGMAELRAQGRPVSGPSVADRPELAARIVAMREGGMTLHAICDTLNAEGVPTLRGGARWRPSSVESACGYRRPPARRRSVELPVIPRRRRTKVPA
ncbi:MAG: recombinase family protein [Actinomycetota bacterium]|nr:recombinase family protein [Actinomycetota bacterium]